MKTEIGPNWRHDRKRANWQLSLPRKFWVIGKFTRKFFLSGNIFLQKRTTKSGKPPLGKPKDKIY